MHPAYFETRFAADEPPPSWPHQFAVITAYSTTGQQWAAERNVAADQDLERHLREQRCLVCRITGYSPTTGHAEPGWAAQMDWQEACDLGATYHQDAIYFVTGDDLWVSYCDDRRALAGVGSFRDRLS